MFSCNTSNTALFHLPHTCSTILNLENVMHSFFLQVSDLQRGIIELSIARDFFFFKSSKYCHSHLTYRGQLLTSANKYIFIFFTLSQLLQHFQLYALPFASRMLRPEKCYAFSMSYRPFSVQTCWN